MNNKTKRLTESAMLIALAVVLEFAGRFTPDPAFPDWARSARRRILQELVEL